MAVVTLSPACHAGPPSMLAQKHRRFSRAPDGPNLQSSFPQGGMPHMPQEELSFTYFPENYRWSHGLLIGLNMAPWGGAEIGEINRIGLRLKNRVGDDNAWFREWAREARTVEDRGRERIADGRTLSGAQYLQRASAYYHVGERFLQPKGKEGLDAYMRGVDCLREAAKHIKRPRLEHVEIPYEGTSIPAIYVHAEPARSGGKVPAMVFFDGLDVTKEIQYFKGVSDLVARGIACLIVDGPGNGESIRFRNLYLHHETERYATPAWEYLAARPEIDAKRIGVMAISLGGYYAPRAAAFEKRFKLCVAWGANHNWGELQKKRLAREGDRPVPHYWDHVMWVWGKETLDEFMAFAPRVSLVGVVKNITVPFLITHGANDRQIPLAYAHQCYEEAVNSPKRELKIFTDREGGVEHVSADNMEPVRSYIADWIERTFASLSA
jgi:dipeptidyl aminopeptidase/acylaminoacyl peptidase